MVPGTQMPEASPSQWQEWTREIARVRGPEVDIPVERRWVEAVNGYGGVVPEAVMEEVIEGLRREKAWVKGQEAHRHNLTGWGSR